jgi:hypothetical protein
VVWAVTACRFVSGYRRFEVTCCLNLKCSGIDSVMYTYYKGCDHVAQG